MMLLLHLAAALFAPLSHSTPLDEVDPQVLYSHLTGDLLANSEGGDCSLRSDVWAYELEKMTREKPSKILLLYTKDDPNQYGWIFHIAPALKINHEWQIFEKANGIESALSPSEWMKRVNGGSICEMKAQVPSSVKDSFNQGRAGFMEYDPERQLGKCMAFIVGDDVSTPEQGFLDFKPRSETDKRVSSREKAIDSCATFNGRYRYGAPLINGYRSKTSAFKDETKAAKLACQQAIDQVAESTHQ